MRHLTAHAVPDLAPCLERNLEAARLTNPDVRAVGIALNTAALPPADGRRACEAAERLLGLPCQDPVRDGVERIADRLAAAFPA